MVCVDSVVRSGGFFRVLWCRRWELTIVLLMTFIYAFSYFQRVAVPGTIFDELQSELQVSSAAIAMFGSLYLYVYGGMQLFAGMFVDRFGPMRVILTGGFLLSVGSVLFPLSHSISMLYVMRVLVGLGASLLFLSIIKEIDVRFSGKNFPVALSVVLLTGYSGGLLGTRPFAGAVEAFGWRSSLLAVGVACSVAVLLTGVVMRRSYAGVPRQAADAILPALRRVILNRLSWPVFFTGVVIFTNYFIMQGIIGKKFLEDCFGFGSARAASFTFAMMLASITSGVLAGFLTRLLGNRRKPLVVISVVCTVLSPVLGLLALSHGVGWLLPCYVLFGVASGGNPLISSLMKELNEPEYAASSVGVVNAGIYLSIAVFTTVIGHVLDAFRAQAVVTARAIQYPPEAYRLIFVGLLVLALSILVVCAFIRETCGRNLWSHESSKSLEGV